MRNFLRLVPAIVSSAFCWVSPVLAQPIPLPTAVSEVEACFQIASRAPDQQLVSWDDIQPCFAALELNLAERQRVATLTNLGIAQTYLGDFVQARNSFDQALQLSVAYPDVYLNRANLFYLEQNFEAAIRDYSEAIRLGAESLELLYLNRGMAYQNTRQYGLAEADYRAALTARPNWTLVAEKLEALEIERSRALSGG